MKTEHRIIFGKAQSMPEIEDESVNLVVTSPPYPMIEMWDDIFALQDESIRERLDRNESQSAFELMHLQLDAVWKELYRVVRPGGIVCINIGDATRTIDGDFQLYSNHARIINACTKLGFSNLPNILWRKQTNAPNKFMGSGMLPPGAYVTLEHEHILIFRKGGKRVFSNESEKRNRAESAYFWEERNVWFSDLWDLKGTKQKLQTDQSRGRSGAFPFELAYRLINMFSVKDDVVLDPFLGTGTTSLAALCSGRNSLGVEIDADLKETILSSFVQQNVDGLNDLLRRRILNHQQFVSERIRLKGDDAFKHQSKHYSFPVITKQETEILINFIKSIEQENGAVSASYHAEPMLDFIGLMQLHQQ